jgi:hypothetical protein
VLGSFYNLGERRLATRFQKYTLAIALLIVTSGCVGSDYRYGLHHLGGPFEQACVVELDHPITVDGEHLHVDRIERFVQAPRERARKMMGRTEPNQEFLREQAVDEAVRYLESNGLSDVHVDVRCYQPRQQWQRLVENDRIGPIWKYTAGSLNVVAYSLFPRRAFRSDRYSPFTNTLSINSTNSASALFQAAQAKQYHGQKWLGTYSVAQKAPIVPLVHLSKVSSDVLTYAHANHRSELAQELYPVAYSKLGSAVVSGVVFFFPVRTDVPFITSPIIKLTSRATGRLAGKLAADQYAGELANDPEALESDVQKDVRVED